MTGRVALSDCDVMGTKIRKNDLLLLPFYIMQRTERLWDKPHVFDPDRFIKDPDLNRGRGKFMPFGGGPRVCVGASFAIIETMALMVGLVRRYDFDIAPDIYPTPTMSITLHPKGGIPVQIRPK